MTRASQSRSSVDEIENIRGLAALTGLQRERIRLLEAVVEYFPGGLSLYDANMQMVLCNERQKQLLDYPDSLFSKGFPTLEELFRFNALRGEYGPGDIEEHVARRVALLREGKPHVYERTRPNGTVLEVRGMPIEGGGFVTTYFDVTDQRRTQALIAHMAHHDTLTDLPNRALFTDRLTKAVALARRGSPIALHYIDLDRFKTVNDQFGHQAGDELLKAVALRLTGAVRDNDTVARLGGDEFAIVQTGIYKPHDATVLAKRVLSRFKDPIAVAGQKLSAGLSIGIACAPIHGQTVDTLMAKADAALYQSKANGRGQFSLA